MTALPARRALTLSVKLAVALRALGIKETEIDWSHEPALGLRAINDEGTDYKPAQHDPEYIFIRKCAAHDELTFKDNGTGRSDLTAIAHVRRIIKKDDNHNSRMSAKKTGETFQEKPRKKIQSRGFSKGHRPLQSRGFRA